MLNFWIIILLTFAAGALITYLIKNMPRIFFAIVLTLVAGAVGAFLEPVSFAVALPISVMGAFILHALMDKDK